jgi:uroporphyrin-III C-methyltransferase
MADRRTTTPNASRGTRPRSETSGKVFLIGAGPGDPKLLTLRAAEILAKCDLIVFDSLVNPEVLAHARRGVELVFAGKRAGTPEISQAEINDLLVARASAGHLVVRLKGGDPFVFGRGGEEAEALVAAGIDFEIIPGVSSGVAAPAYAGIPLTHRTHSSSVIFVTGHDAPDKGRPRVDWQAIAKAADTIVIFMCARTIRTIARELVAGGRTVTTPIAIIRWGTYQDQEVYSGTLADFAERDADDPVIESPSIAVIGGVVALREQLAWFEKTRELASAPGECSEPVGARI